MLIPSPFPDELARGFFGRIRKQNRLANEAETVARLGRDFHCDTDAYAVAPAVVLLARACAMSTKDFCRQHTLLPYFKAIVHRYQLMAHGDQDGTAVLRKFALRKGLWAASFCPSCVAEDSDFWGITYWRRSHQLPGVDWCHKHGDGLRRASVPAPFQSSPVEFQDRFDKVDASMVRLVSEYPALGRYAEIGAALLNEPYPVAVEACCAALRQRINEIGIPPRPHARKWLLTDTVREEFPQTWLAAHFPVIALRRTGNIVESIDTLTYRGAYLRGVTIYVLLLAALFDTPEQALNALLSTPLPEQLRGSTPTLTELP